MVTVLSRLGLSDIRLPLIALFFVSLGRTVASDQPVHPLVWDSVEKSYEAKPGEHSHTFSFAVVNSAKDDVTVYELTPSCGCTVAELPKKPWTLSPNEKGVLKATLDFTGKSGLLTKTIEVSSSSGPQRLTLHINIPNRPRESVPEPAKPGERVGREENLLLARADRQAVFRGDCARCHGLDIATGSAPLSGPAIYAAVCAVCHDAPNRASMVPALPVPNAPRTAAYWRQWIEGGKESTLMPAFAQEKGGPLSAQNITALVEYLIVRHSHHRAEP